MLLPLPITSNLAFPTGGAQTWRGGGGVLARTAFFDEEFPSSHSPLTELSPIQTLENRRRSFKIQLCLRSTDFNSDPLQLTYTHLLELLPRAPSEQDGPGIEERHSHLSPEAFRRRRWICSQAPWQDSIAHGKSTIFLYMTGMPRMIPHGEVCLRPGCEVKLQLQLPRGG